MDAQIIPGPILTNNPFSGPIARGKIITHRTKNITTVRLSDPCRIANLKSRDKIALKRPI